VLIPLGAGVLSALCIWFSWRALRRCQAIEAGSDSAARESQPDELEDQLLVRERNLELSLAARNVQALRRAALFGGSGLAFWALSAGGAGGREYDLVQAGEAFAAGFVGWAGCGELQRRIGSAADAWRRATNAKSRKRRQGVDQSERTG
jgi:hypothetical protein